MTTPLTFPAAEPTDPEDVAWTLQTAGTMWARGDSHEAVRWLRRAAEAAGDAGDDMRAVALARAAADLSADLNLPPSILPPAVAADQTHKMTPVESSPITPMDDAETSHDHTIPDGPAMEAPRSPPPLRRPPPPPSSRSSPSASPARSSPHPPPVSARSSPSAAPPVSSPTHPAPHSSPSAAHRSSPSAARSSPSVPPGAMAYRQRQTLRVSVTLSHDEKNLLLVRPLADDEPLPEGAHEALLTALEPGAHLLSKKR